jgi:predicted secreted Zn-dependent protease
VLLARSDVSRYALAHEQTHFDLSEVSARRMRRALAALADPCSMTDEALHAIVDPFIREDFTRQRRYDTETLNGSNIAWQRDWEMRVERELRELVAFVR